jgi:hypothetical protein
MTRGAFCFREAVCKPPVIVALQVLSPDLLVHFLHKMYLREVTAIFSNEFFFPLTKSAPQITSKATTLASKHRPIVLHITYYY